MHVISYEIHNVKRISDLEMDLQGRHLVLYGGKNDQGKSSAIQALVMALCGRSGMDWPEPALKEGEDEGWIRVKLSGHESLQEDQFVIAEIHFERKRDGSVADKFRLLNSVGDESPNPRKLLKDLYQNRAFDPLAFDRASKKDRREILMKLVGLDLDEFKAQHKEIYDNRTAVNKEAERAKAKLELLPRHDDVEPVVVTDLMNELEEANKLNKSIADADASIATALKDWETATVKMGTLEAQAADSVERNADIVAADAVVENAQKTFDEARSVVLELEAKLVKARALVDKASAACTDAVILRSKLGNVINETELGEAIKQAAETVEDFHKIHEAAIEARKSLGDAVDTSSISSRIKEAGEINAKAQANQVYAAAESEYKALLVQSKAMTKSLDDLAKSQDKAMKAAKWPVPGMSVDNEGVLIDGLPFESACKSKRISSSVHVGMSLHPELRLLVCEDGNDLDLETLEQLEKDLIENDFQMLVEFVTRSDQDEAMCAVVIEDGKAKEMPTTKAPLPPTT